MFQQYRKIDGNICKLIEVSSKFDYENEDTLKKYENKEDGLKEIFLNWQDKDILLIADSSVVNPIWDNNLKTIREMTKEELILMKNEVELLIDGEYIETGEIKTIEKPLDLIRPIWNKELREWQEGMTKEELMLKRVDLIMEYNSIKNKITTLEELREFESTETIELLKTKMNKIKEEADMLLEKIKKLK